MPEWSNVNWGVIATLEYGKALRGYQVKQGPVRVFGTNGPVGWTEKAQSSGPGVIIGRKGAYRGVHYSPDPFWVIDTAYYLKPKIDMDLRWAYYAIRNLDINSLDSGSAIPSTSRPDFYALPVRFPPLAEQLAISSMLGAIDDKIISDTRIASSGEKLASSLFSSEGNLTKTPLGRIVDHVKVQVAPALIKADRIALYSIPAFDSDRLPEFVIPAAIKSGKFKVESPAVLVSKLNPSTPRVWNLRRVAQGCSLASTEFLVLRPRASVTTDDIWAACSQSGFANTLMETASGTSNSHQRVRPADVLSTEVVDPESVSRNLRAMVSGIAQRASAARYESRLLAQLRDTLLPKLMAGEIRVRDAERIVEDLT